MADKQVKLKITSAIAIGGQIQRAGTVVAVSEDVAKNLLHRGRAELATAEMATGPETKGGDDAGKVKGGKK
ncbi:hypothetical protein [Pukyongiella litopenaei]|uniref:Uncharacterized protein n=1 Tax=Pukyongiella litopenaei TaxID=2605946 RepID=A0A2S0MNH5_9RHOB|nr:hypothetical protein [Pukyongiella litopenaei]AVO37387.1 hypothetical protein C6Y53_06465 [Pukyongiella litopenaei]